MPPKPAAPAEAGSKQVKPKQKKAPAPKKTQPIDDIDCTAGKFSAAGSAECDDCAAGKFSATIGATLCDDNDCTAGKFSTAGSAECDDDCAAGKFSATIGAIKAKAVDYKSTIEARGTLLHGEKRGTKSSTFSRCKSVLISRGCKPQPFSPLHHHHRRPRRQYHTVTVSFDDTGCC